MPLAKGKGQATISANISELHHGPQYARTKEEHGAETANRQAIAIAMETARKSRAKGGKVHVGPIKGDGPGRTDIHEMAVPDGAYVLPSELISHLGQNNTAAGLKRAQEMFGPGGEHAPKGRASGGATSSGKPVDCVTASGEFVISPEVVRHIGGGDLAHGHKVLDRFVMHMRDDHIRTLKRLPEPARD